MDMTPQTWPEWYDGRHINEVRFCQQFLEKHPMKCVRGRLFTVDGLIEDEGQIGNLILEEISGVLTANLSKTVANLLASIKLQAYSPPLPIETDRIHVANGTYFIRNYGGKKLMKSNLRNEIKSYIVRQGMTMQEVVDLLRDEHGWSDSVSNLSNKLQRESLRYVEAVQLADALGYEIVWQKRR